MTWKVPNRRCPTQDQNVPQLGGCPTQSERFPMVPNSKSIKIPLWLRRCPTQNGDVPQLRRCPTRNGEGAQLSIEISHHCFKGAKLRMKISHNLEGAQLGMAKVPNSESIYYSSFKHSNRHWNSSNVHFSPPREPHGTLRQKLHRSDNIILGQHLQLWEPYSWDLMGGKHARYGKIDEIQLGPLNFYHIAPPFFIQRTINQTFSVKEPLNLLLNPKYINNL